MDNFTEFFNDTGSSIDSFQVNQTIEKAKTFSQKLQDLIGPEAGKFIAQEQARADRLNAKEAIVPNVPNSALYYIAAAGALYLGYRLLFK